MVLSFSLTTTRGSPASAHFLAQSPATLGAHFASVIQPSTVCFLSSAAARDNEARNASAIRTDPSFFMGKFSFFHLQNCERARCSSCSAQHHTLKPTSRSLFLRRGLLRRGQRIYDLAGTCVAEPLAGFPFYRRRLRLEGLNLLLAAVVVLLH